jgi:hypothetical protein
MVGVESVGRADEAARSTVTSFLTGTVERLMTALAAGSPLDNLQFGGVARDAVQLLSAVE